MKKLIVCYAYRSTTSLLISLTTASVALLTTSPHKPSDSLIILPPR